MRHDRRPCLAAAVLAVATAGGTAGALAAIDGGANGLRPDANGHMTDYADAPKRRRL